MNTQYTPEQIEDIKARVEKGTEALKELGLEVAVQIIPYLQDVKYKIENKVEASDNDSEK